MVDSSSGASTTQTYVDDVFNIDLDDGSGKKYVKTGINFVGPVNAVTGEIYTHSANRVDCGRMAFDSSGNKYELLYIASGATCEIIKKNSSDTLVWTRTIAEPGGRAQPRDIKVLPNGNVIVLCYNNRATFDYYTMLTLYDSSGTILWHKGIENGAEYTQGNLLDFDSSSNIYILGSSGGTANFISFHKVAPSNGSILFQKRIYETTTYYSSPLTLQVDGSDVWVTMTTQSAEGGGYWSKLIKLNTSGTIVYKKTFKNLNSVQVDSTFIYAGISDSTNSKIGSVVKLNKSDLSVALQISFKHTSDPTPNIAALFGGFIWVSLSSGIILKLDSSLNIISKFAACTLETQPNITYITPTLGFYNTNMYFNGGYTGSINCNFTAKTSYTFDNLVGNINSLVLLYTPTLTSISNVTSVSIYDDTRLTTANDVCVVSNSTATFGTADILTSKSTFSIASSIAVKSDAMFWFKRRDVATENHLISDTTTGLTVGRATNSTAADISSGDSYFLLGYTDTGFIKNSNNTSISQGSNVGWTFRKAPKFFDIVSYTGNGSAGQTITHSLGVAPGMIIIKRTDAAEDWFVWHRGDGASSVTGIPLNLTNAAGWNSSGYNITSATTIPLGNINMKTGNGSNPVTLNASHIAYIFAHDASATGLIQCGSYTGNGSATGPNISLGWEAQFVLIKKATGGAGGWLMFDTMRGMSKSIDAYLLANTVDAESSLYEWLEPNATGFTITTNNGNVNTSAETYIYIAIRRPNKPPLNGTQVYAASKYNGNASTATLTSGFPVDFSLLLRSVNTQGHYIQDRLRGKGNALATMTTAAETTGLTSWSFSNSTGVDFTTDFNGSGEINTLHMFKRAPGFMDVVCYTGDSTYNKNIPHTLTVTPELIICKPRNRSENWMVFHKDHIGYYLILNATDARATDWGTLTTTATNLVVSPTGLSSPSANASTYTYVAYLFATLSGISKVGSYTGNGTSLTVNCGFATGSRFILIKRTDAVGDWYVWDSTRGIIGANDPHISLNATAAEVTTDDSIDPDNTGFIVNQVAATNINVTSAKYIFLAIA